MKKKKSFRHNSNLRNESAMVRLRIALGPAGYGIYFMLCEHIYQSAKPLQLDDLDLLAYEFHAPADDVRAVVTQFGLFAETPEGYLLVEQGSLQSRAPKAMTRPATTQADPSDSSDPSDNFDDLYEVVDGPGSEFSRMPIKQQIKRTMSRRETYEQLLDAAGGDKARLKQITNALIANNQPFPALSILVTAAYELNRTLP